MGVIGRYDDKRVAVFAGKIECGLHGFIQIDCFADLPARIGGMVLFVDGGTFHLKEKAFFVGFQQVDGFLGHLRQCRNIGSALLIDLALDTGSLSRLP